MPVSKRLALIALLLVVLALGFAFYALRSPSKPPPSPPLQPQVWEVTLCYPDLKANQLVRFAIAIAANTEERVVRELVERLKRPDDPNLSPALPQGTKVLSVRREGEVMVLDLSPEATEPTFWQGSGVAHLRLQALVHTLCSLPNTRAVRLLVKGQTPEALGGHEEVSEPLEPDPTL